MKIRIKFRKWGVMKFIGHLDVMRYFQKAMRRANIDIAYSAGYSPHQIMSFAAPLGVGLTSDGEYLDIEANSVTTSKEAVDALNATMVDGVEVVSFRLLPDDAKNAMSIVAASDYRVSFAKEVLGDNESFAQAILISTGLSLSEFIQRFFEQDEILISKKTKKSEAVINLKPMIYQLKEDDDSLFMQITTGSAANIKPSLVLEAMSNFEQSLTGESFIENVLTNASYGIQTHRMEVYANINTPEEPMFVPLEDLGEEIV